MARPPVPLRLLLPAVAALWAPVGMALAILVAADMLAPGPAIVAAGAVAVLLGLLVRPFFCDILALKNFVEQLSHTSEPHPPSFFFTSAPAELHSAIARHHRARMAERARLERAAAANATVLDRLPDPLIQLGRNRQVVRANQAARELLGKEIAGSDLSTVLRNPGVLDATDTVLAGKREAAVPFALPVPVEREFLAGIIALPQPTADGTVAILRLHDLTEIKRTEQMRADFVANVSHELKTPLTTLMGYIETLKGPARGDAEAEARFLSTMENQAARMNSLVDDLLSLSRIELHEHARPTDRVDLRDMLDEIAGQLALRAEAKGQRIAVEVAPEADSVLGERAELMQVFENLIDNAIKYADENTVIEVTAAPGRPTPGMDMRRGDVGVVAVSVKDRGKGIPRQHIPRLTERFYRVDPARSRQLGGTGLGLAIVKHIVNRHRGDVRIESKVGKGSTFTVLLPAAAAGKAGETAAAREPGAA